LTGGGSKTRSRRALCTGSARRTFGGGTFEVTRRDRLDVDIASSLVDLDGAGVHFASRGLHALRREETRGFAIVFLYARRNVDEMLTHERRRTTRHPVADALRVDRGVDRRRRRRRRRGCRLRGARADEEEEKREGSIRRQHRPGNLHPEPTCVLVDPEVPLEPPLAPPLEPSPPLELDDDPDEPDDPLLGGGAGLVGSRVSLDGGATTGGSG